MNVLPVVTKSNNIDNFIQIIDKYWISLESLMEIKSTILDGICVNDHFIQLINYFLLLLVWCWHGTRYVFIIMYLIARVIKRGVNFIKKSKSNPYKLFYIFIFIHCRILSINKIHVCHCRQIFVIFMSQWNV